MASGNTAFAESGRPFEPVADDEEDVPHAAVIDFRKHAHPVLRELATPVAAGPDTEHAPMPFETDANRRKEGSIGDLAITDLGVDRINEHRRVNR